MGCGQVTHVAEGIQVDSGVILSKTLSGVPRFPVLVLLCPCARGTHQGRKRHRRQSCADPERERNLSAFRAMRLGLFVTAAFLSKSWLGWPPCPKSSSGTQSLKILREDALDPCRSRQWRFLLRNNDRNPQPKPPAIC